MSRTSATANAPSQARRWVKRAIVTTLAFAAVFALGTWLQMHPNPVALAGLVLAIAAIVWFCADVWVQSVPLDWSPPEPEPFSSRGADVRVGMLRRRLGDAIAEPRPRDGLRPIFTAVIDERLAANHGIDRRTDPERARAVLGEQLCAYLDHPPGKPMRYTRRQLDALITRIEDL